MRYLGGKGRGEGRGRRGRTFVREDLYAPRGGSSAPPTPSQAALRLSCLLSWSFSGRDAHSMTNYHD